MFFQNKENTLQAGLISKPNPKETNEKMQNFQNQTKNLTKHPFNKRFSVGAVLERNFKEENPLKSKDLNQTNPINPQNFEKANNLDEFNKILEEFEEDEKNIPAQLSKSSEVIQEEITKRKSVTSNFSANFNKAEQNIPENEVYPDPLEKYRAVKKTFQKNFEEPKEIWQNPNKRRNILILVVLILFSLVLCNLFLANKKKIDIQQENNSNSSISQESKHEKHQTNFDQIQEDGYKKIALPIYQRLKVEVQVYKSISLNKIESDLVERYGEPVVQKIWPLVTYFREEEQMIVEKFDTENDEKIWTLREL